MAADDSLARRQRFGVGFGVSVGGLACGAASVRAFTFAGFRVRDDLVVREGDSTLGPFFLALAGKQVGGSDGCDGKNGENDEDVGLGEDLAPLLLLWVNDFHLKLLHLGVLLLSRAHINC